jgi:hypothetical protein
MRTPRLLVFDRTDASADLNGLVRFAERRNLVSARVPSHFNWPLPIDKKGDKQKVEKCREISVLDVCCKPYSETLNEKLKARAEKFLVECQNGFRKGRSFIHPLLNVY